MSQHMQFDEESEREGYRPSALSPYYQEAGPTYDSPFGPTDAEKLTPLSQPYPRSVRLLGLLLILLNLLLIFGMYLSLTLHLLPPGVVIAIVGYGLFFIGFWLILRKSKRPTSRN
jgi:hypothetical protein